MKSYRRVSESVIMFLILSLLTACGGGGGTTPNPSPSTYSISGTVTSSGSGLQGVTMTLSGASSASATTDTSGNYTFTGLVNGGAFLLGNKNHDDMMAFCTEFARKGYVTASINYRLGMNVASAMSATRAVYRGLQDGRSAVRFFRKNAAKYGIDANKVYDKLTQLGSANKLSYFVDGQGHEFYGVLNGAWTNGTGGNEFWNIILEKAVGFFYGQI
jgi:hypothetical protein